MIPHLITKIAAYKEYYLFISGYSSNCLLSIVDKDLNLLSEHQFEGISLWGADFHIDEDSSMVIISVVTTEIFPIENKSYQGFNTLWYALEESKLGFCLRLIERIEKSNITRIQSKIINAKHHWVALRQMHFITHKNGIQGYRCILGFENSNNIQNIPKFKSAQGLSRPIDTNFDFTFVDNNYYLSIIGKHGGEVPTILRINNEKKYLEIIELEIPIKKLHNFESTKLLNINDNLYAYFWIGSQERCKKFRFEMYKVDVGKESLMQCSYKHVINSESVREVIWNKPDLVAYKKEDHDRSYIAQLKNNGDIEEIRCLENWNPVYFGKNNDIICRDKEKKELKIIHLER
jgi:hypothetical protein